MKNILYFLIGLIILIGLLIGAFFIGLNYNRPIEDIKNEFENMDTDYIIDTYIDDDTRSTIDRKIDNIVRDAVDRAIDIYGNTGSE